MRRAWLQVLLAFRFVICNCLWFTGSLFFLFILSYAIDMLRLLILPLGFFFFLLWVPSDYFLLQYFNPFFLFLLLCTLWLNIFFYAWGPTHRSHGFHTFCLCFCFLFCVIKLHTLHALPRLFLHPPIELSIPHTFQS